MAEELVTCEECKEDFDISAYDDIDAEFDEDHPLCPRCQELISLRGKTCEYCEEPATHIAGDLCLCEIHFEEYMSDRLDDSLGGI